MDRRSSFDNENIQSRSRSLLERLRSRQLCLESVTLAAFLGDKAARAICGDGLARIEEMELRQAMEILGRDRVVAIRTLIALGNAVLDVDNPRHSIGRNSISSAEAWVMTPTKDNILKAGEANERCQDAYCEDPDWSIETAQNASYLVCQIPVESDYLNPLFHAVWAARVSQRATAEELIESIQRELIPWLLEDTDPIRVRFGEN